ncbi:MAG: tetratricopeptide repeat protein [Bacteroidales bacterium]|nr:tetratricopeptide repeat protein [Bacteroidales bacterium]
MSDQKTQHDGLDEVNEALSKTEQLIEKYQKPMLISALVLILVVSGILALRQFYFIPKENKAQEDLFVGEFLLQEKEYQKALEGNGGDFIGFEAIIKENSSTKAGNLAKAYAGICQMRLGNYEQAIKHLESFSASDLLVSPAVVGAVGDCYVEMGKVKEAIAYFEKAAAKANNELISPIYLKKAGIAYESLGQYADAVKVYQNIKDNWSTSMESADIEKYIERASSKK